jgi:hypothetical protein
MERVNYTSTQTDGTGATATRMTGVFGDAANGTNLQTAIQTAIDNIAALGVPIANIAGGSSVAAFFTVPRVTLNQGTCAFVITELCRMVPDVMVYFDYSTATPTLQVTRRGVATTRTLTLGTDEVDTLNIKPVFEMKVDQVALPFIERDVLGRTKFNQQQSGTAATGRVQIITVSGPELDTFLPNDLFEVQPVRSSLTLNDFVYDNCTQFDAAKQAGMLRTALDYNGTSFFLYNQPNVTSISSLYYSPSPIITDEAKKVFTITDRELLSPESLSDWAVNEYGLTRVNITGQWSGLFLTKLNTTLYPLPTWLQELNFKASGAGWQQSGTGNWGLYEFFTGEYTATAFLTPVIQGKTGTSRSGGTTNTIVLATAASSVDDYYNGKDIAFIRSGTTHTAKIIDYVGSTKTATLDRTFAFTIVSGYPYTIYFPYFYSQAGTATGGSATTITLSSMASDIDDFYVNREITWTKSATATFSDTITDYNGTTKVATLSQSWSAAQQPANGNAYALDGHPLYRPADYSFISPPTNLAANLLAAQNFVPYEGEIALTQETVGAVRYRGCKINVDNSLTPHATMGALVSAETLDLKQGTTQITLGTPPRVDYRTFVDRIRKTPQDNIVFDV